VPIDGSRAPLRIVDDAVRLAYAPDSSQLFFSSANGIFALPLAGGTPVLVSPLPGTATGTSELTVSDDGRWIVFRAVADGHDQVHSAAVDGSTGPLRLNGVLVQDRGVDLHAIAPGGTRVVYRANQDTRAVKELYSAPIDGSAAAVKLSGALTAQRALAEWKFSRDGSRVLYRADQDVDDVYSAPIAGGQPPVKLNGPLVPNGDVEGFAPADGGAVLYLADLPGRRARRDERDDALAHRAPPVPIHHPATGLAAPRPAHRLRPPDARGLRQPHGARLPRGRSESARGPVPSAARFAKARTHLPVA
jgi:Tol biopolymer transport system component